MPRRESAKHNRHPADRHPVDRRPTVPAAKTAAGPKPATVAARALHHGPTAAQLQTTIELLTAIEADARPADPVVAAFLRARPWLQPRDRGLLLRRVAAVLRRRDALDWWIARAASGVRPGARSRLLAHIMLAEARPADQVTPLFGGGRNAPAPLERRESALLDALAGQPLLHPDMPLPVRAAFPAWLEPELRRAFGTALEVEMQALAEPGPLDLRANLLQADRPAALAALTAERLMFAPTPYSPLGLRLERGIDLGRCTALLQGLVEPQDEGSQLAALLVDARPGQYVVDYCAGAGGKTLALAAQMRNHGRLIAADISKGRLDRAKLRLRRAGAFNVERRDTAERKWFKRQAGRADRVLVDAPCTGIGSWRRIADARWRLRPDDVPELVALQREILDQAAPLVALGGRLIYVTCSVLPAENWYQVEAFLARHADFALLPIAKVWSETVGGDCPASGPTLQLTPARHHTGGFFVAVLERRVPAAADATTTATAD